MVFLLLRLIHIYFYEFYLVIKFRNLEVYLEEQIGKDKDDNTITLKEILENDEKSIDEEIELKLNIKKFYEKIKTMLK